MTREQIIKNLEYLIQFLPGKSIYAEKTLTCAIAALRGPQPDPITGLVPCGCGGKAETHELFGEYSGTYMTDCKECATGTTQYNTEKESQDAWNTSMGWKGGAE